MPLYVTCFVPSLRVIIPSFPGTPAGNVNGPLAVNGGQIVAHLPVQLLTFGVSFVNRYNVLPALSVSTAPTFGSVRTSTVAFATDARDDVAVVLVLEAVALDDVDVLEGVVDVDEVTLAVVLLTAALDDVLVAVVLLDAAVVVPPHAANTSDVTSNPAGIMPRNRHCIAHSSLHQVSISQCSLKY